MPSLRNLLICVWFCFSGVLTPVSTNFWVVPLQSVHLTEIPGYPISTNQFLHKRPTASSLGSEVRQMSFWQNVQDQIVTDPWLCVNQRPFDWQPNALPTELARPAADMIQKLYLRVRLTIVNRNSINLNSIKFIMVYSTSLHKSKQKIYTITKNVNNLVL